ncbi:hypothetical protein [Streptomyces chartreusis]|uniref:hypothetical protein n=1 Tax=Streptomyces chartreusis TaxID=1969 RepID=UPI00365EB8D4
MSDSARTLPETLARIEELIALSGRARDEVLNIRELSHATGLYESEVELLLAGGHLDELDEEDQEALVRQRVRFLYEQHRGPNDGPRDVREIAAAIGQTPTWTKKLVEGTAKPSLVSGSRLTKYYEVAATFLTDSPDEALNRELRPVLFDLEVEADPGKTLKEMGVLHLSSRSPVLGKQDLAALAKMVASIHTNLDQIQRVLDQTTDPEGKG